MLEKNVRNLGIFYGKYSKMVHLATWNSIFFLGSDPQTPYRYWGFWQDKNLQLKWAFLGGKPLLKLKMERSVILPSEKLAIIDDDNEL